MKYRKGTAARKAIALSFHDIACHFATSRTGRRLSARAPQCGGEAQARREAGGRLAEVALEGAGEVGGISVAQLKGGGLGGPAGGEELRGAGHALALEDFAQRDAERAAAVALKLAQGDLQQPGGDSGIVISTRGQFAPGLLGGEHIGGISMAGHEPGANPASHDSVLSTATRAERDLTPEMLSGRATAVAT